jgi:hypothetical protein
MMMAALIDQRAVQVPDLLRGVKSTERIRLRITIQQSSRNILFSNRNSSDKNHPELMGCATHNNRLLGKRSRCRYTSYRLRLLGLKEQGGKIQS